MTEYGNNPKIAFKNGMHFPSLMIDEMSFFRVYGGYNKAGIEGNWGTSKNYQNREEAIKELGLKDEWNEGTYIVEVKLLPQLSPDKQILIYIGMAQSQTCLKNGLLHGGGPLIFFNRNKYGEAIKFLNPRKLISTKNEIKYICSQCNSPYSPNDKFCGECGKNF